MYCYIYDDVLARSNYQRELEAIEIRLHDLDIQGNICRLSPLKNLQEIMVLAEKGGIKTVVAVGDDKIVERMMNIIVSHSLKLVLGIVPLGGTSYDIAKSLSIPIGVDACNILSYRMIRTLRLGRINNRYFLTSVACQGNLRVECNDDFSISSMRGPASLRRGRRQLEPVKSQLCPDPSLR